MSRIIKRKRIYMCMASVMCMLLLLIPLPVSANDLGSILLKATVLNLRCIRLEHMEIIHGH